jgi:hypothetical protein
MRYVKECKTTRPFFGLYCKLWEDEGDPALWDEVFKMASAEAGVHALHNREFIVALLKHYKATLTGQGHGHCELWEDGGGRPSLRDEVQS